MNMTYDQNAFRPTENRIILNFSQCNTPDAIHEMLKKSFGLPEYYGKNWSALDDCLFHLWLDEGCVTVELHHFHELREEAKEYCIPMLEIFDDVHRETPNVVFKILS